MVLHKAIPPYQYFITRDGKRISTLEELADAFDEMSMEIYGFHTKEHGNDFSHWIGDVFGELKLKKDVRRCMIPIDASKAIRDAIKKDALKKEINDNLNLHKDELPDSIYKAIADNKPVVQKIDEKIGVAKEKLINNEEIPIMKEPVEETSNIDIGVNGTNNWDDEHFAPIKKQMNIRNEKLSEKFESIYHRLAEATSDPMPEELNKLGEKLNNRYLELLSKISEQRKLGKDMLYAALQAKQFTAKLALAKATRQKFDFAVAKEILDQTEFAINEAIEEKELSVKDEIEAIVTEQNKEINMKSNAGSSDAAVDEKISIKPQTL